MDRRRTVISGIRGILNGERRGIAARRRASRAGAPGSPSLKLSLRLHEEQDDRDDEDEENERLDEGQAEEHGGLDARDGARLARHGVHGRAGGATLAQSAESRGQAEAQDRKSTRLNS